MTRGNQREKDRERAQARGGNKGNKGKDDGLTPEQRRERDAKALQEKAAKKAAQAVGGESSGGGIRGSWLEPPGSVARPPRLCCHYADYGVLSQQREGEQLRAQRFGPLN